VERQALSELSEALTALPQDASAEQIQTVLYDVGRKQPRYQDMEAKSATPERPGVSLAWFNALYQILLGEERGPRFGSFVALFGLAETRALIEDALAGKFLK
jgi:lysyl-tRNA synthetase class 1